MSTKDQPTRSTRDVILDAAVLLFAEQGPGITLDEIARRAGLSRQSVYVHFGSRTGLLVALVQHFDAQGMLDGLVEKVMNAASPLLALDAVAHLHAEYSPVAYPIARVFITSRHEDEALEVAWKDRMEGRRHLYRHVVQWLQNEGLLAPEWRIEDATDMVSALASWQVWEQLVIEQHWSKERYRKHLSYTLRAALVAGTEQKPST